MSKKWSFESAKTVGRSHLRETPPIPCQDSVLTIERNGVIVTTLSDGCGSSLVSEVGSDITTKVICNYLADNFDEVFASSDIDIKKKIVACVIEALKKYISENPKFVSDYSKKDPDHRNQFLKHWPGFKNAEKLYPLTLLDATIQFVAIKDNKTLIGRLGDGIVGSIQSGNLKIESMEDKIGVESNATWYPSTIVIVLENTQTNPWNNFEIQKIENNSNYAAYFVMSDGVGDVLVGEDRKENTKFLYPDELDRVLKEKNLFGLLENDYKHKSGIFDDLSISVLKTDNWSIKNIVLREYDHDGRTISNDRLEKVSLDEELVEEQVIEKIPEEIILEEPKTEIQDNIIVDDDKTPKIENVKIDIPFDVKYDEALKKQIGNDIEKYQNVLVASVKIWNFMQKKKKATFDDVLNELKPYAEINDVLMYMTYWKKIKLFNVDKLKKTIELR